MPTLLSFGHGYCARALGGLLLARGWRVIGTSRDPAVLPEGVEGVTLEAAGERVAEATHILTSIAPGEDGDPVLALHADALARARPVWAGYLSTTGVFGDRDGAWVGDDDPVRPQSARTRRRVEAERAWAATGLPLHVFRLAGIYGPGRSPFARIRAGTARAILKEGQVFNRVHVDDVVRTLAASMAAPDPGAITLADDEPAAPQDVLAHAAALIGLPPPPAVPFEEADLSEMARGFYAECKRMRNDRMRALAGPLLHPTYREGLAAVLAAEEGAATRD